MTRPARDAQGRGAGLLGRAQAPEPAIPWLCAALIDGKAYLFDARVGLPVPGPDGEGRGDP